MSVSLECWPWRASRWTRGCEVPWGTRRKCVPLYFDGTAAFVKDFGKLFSVVVGQPQRIGEHRSKGNSRRYRTR